MLPVSVTSNPMNVGCTVLRRPQPLSEKEILDVAGGDVPGAAISALQGSVIGGITGATAAWMTGAPIGTAGLVGMTTGGMTGLWQALVAVPGGSK